MDNVIAAVFDDCGNTFPEKSLLIYDIPEDVMHGLAQAFGQEVFASQASFSQLGAWLRAAKEKSDKDDTDKKQDLPGSEKPADSSSDSLLPAGESSQTPISNVPSGNTPADSLPLPQKASIKSITGHPRFAKAHTDALPVISEIAAKTGEKDL